MLVNFYFVLAIGYNLLSIVFMDITGKGLAPTEPTNAIVMMSVIFLIYSATTMLEPFARIMLMVIFLLLILRYGIVGHMLSYSNEVYYSKLSWCSAIAINIFGASVLSLSLFWI